MVTAGILPFRENSHGRAGNRTRDLMISSQRLWPLDHEAGQKHTHTHTQKSESTPTTGRYAAMTDALLNPYFQGILNHDSWLLSALQLSSAFRQSVYKSGHFLSRLCSLTLLKQITGDNTLPQIYLENFSLSMSMQKKNSWYNWK